MSFKVIQTENEKKARNFSNSFSTPKKKKLTLTKTKAKIQKTKLPDNKKQHTRPGFSMTK